MRLSHTVGTPDDVRPARSRAARRGSPVQSRSRKNELRADHGRGIRNAPGVDVKHRHDGQHDAHADRFLASGSEVAETCRSVERWVYRTPLGLPVVPGGITEAGGGTLVELGPVEILALRGEQLFITQQVGEHGRHMGSIGHRDPSLDALACGRERLDEGRERQI